ncbi:hypothetical protein TNCV_80551 [Trichonephila clavipes]|nr:hypothetical protein TNCV_80551 [Trichonephila clavipes]
MIASRGECAKIWKRVVLDHVLRKVSLPTELCFPASRERAGGRSKIDAVGEGVSGFPDGFEMERRPNVCVSHKPSGILFVEDDSEVFYGSGPWNRVVLDMDWWWFSCCASCGEDCFRFCRVYGDFPFIVPVLKLR